MRAWLFLIAAGCGGVAELAEPDVVLAQVESAPLAPVAFTLAPGGTLHDQIHAFTIGASPMTFTATAPRAAQLVVWASRHLDQAVDPSFCLWRTHRFDGAHAVAITLGFDWNPKPGNTRHRYTIDVGGDATSGEITNPLHPVAAIDRGSIPGPAAAGADYLLFAWATDPRQATSFDTLDQAVEWNDRVIAIRARFVEPREPAVAFDPAHCAPAP
jgi:hypothetical protein